MLGFFQKKISKYFKILVILKIPMVSGKKHIKICRTTTDLCFLFKNRCGVNKEQIFSSELMRNSGNCIYDYAHSFFGEDF